VKAKTVKFDSLLENESSTVLFACTIRHISANSSLSQIASTTELYVGEADGDTDREGGSVDDGGADNDANGDVVVPVTFIAGGGSASDGGANGDVDGDVDGDVESDADGDADFDGDLEGDADGDADFDGDLEGDADGDADDDTVGLIVPYEERFSICAQSVLFIFFKLSQLIEPSNSLFPLSAKFR